MSARVEDPQEEKNQHKIEVILEKKQDDLLTQSYSLINLVLVLLGAYAVILSAFLFPDFLPTGSNITNATTSNTVTITLSPLSFFCLIVSIISVIIAAVIIGRSINLGNTGFKNKFISKKCPVPSIQLKMGSKLRNRNVYLLDNTIEQNKYNNHSFYAIICSLVFFIASIITKPGTVGSFIAFFAFLFQQRL